VVASVVHRQKLVNTIYELSIMEQTFVKTIRYVNIQVFTLINIHCNTLTFIISTEYKQ